MATKEYKGPCPSCGAALEKDATGKYLVCTDPACGACWSVSFGQASKGEAEPEKEGDK